VSQAASNPIRHGLLTRRRPFGQPAPLPRTARKSPRGSLQGRRLARFSADPVSLQRSNRAAERLRRYNR